MGNRTILLLFILAAGFLMISCSGDYEAIEITGCDLIQFESEMNRPATVANLSMYLIERLRNNQPTENITECLANITPEDLRASLSAESEKKAFWLNMYNAYIQIILQENPDLFKDRNSWFGYNFFSSPQIVIAGYKLSFDDMEHGIMRRSTSKLSLGYMRNWFIDEVEKELMWEEIDPRIHFALNCGAASCPPVAAFNPDRVDEQLDQTTVNYLSRRTEYFPQENEARVTSLISWFRGDFGGLDGAIDFLKRYDVIPQDSNPTLTFREYDWTLDLGNFQDL